MNFRVISAVLSLLCLSGNIRAQHLVPSSKDSKVEFRVYNHKDGADDLVRGLFTSIGGNIVFDPKELSKASFDITVNAASVNTANHQRDKDLQKANFLSAVKYPTIRIKSTSVTSDGGVIYILHGNLTMKGVTKPVSIQFTATQIRTGYFFRGSFDLNRLLYNVGEKGDIDDKVTVFIEVKAEKK